MGIKRIADKHIDRLAAELHDLSHNLWWSWNPSAQLIFQELSPFFWEHSNHNPVEVMHWISGAELRGRLQDPEFFKHVSEVTGNFRAYINQKRTWGAKNAAQLKKAPVAYFSAEFGLHESLRIYSGGLGILSGDHAKSASDLGLPFVGISLFYRQGYFSQQISNDGWQQELYPTYDPLKLPLTLVKDKKGNPVICNVQLNGMHVAFQAWAVHVGRVTVYLLDTNLPHNDDRSREITAHVYGGDQTTRIAQEIVLGVGGVRLLREIGIHPSVFHMNEGHSAFLTLELLREQLAAKKPLDKAEQTVRQQCVFTTHTPVPAGHDRFSRDLMNTAFQKYADGMGLSIDQLMAYGRIRPEDINETFCMTVLALKMSRDANGVSQLHGRTSVQMWKDLYPDWTKDEDPIGSITNGVHINGWASPTASQFYSRTLGPKWHEHIRDARYWHKAIESKKVSDADLWALRTSLRRELIEFARKRLREQHLRHGGDGIGVYENLLSPDVLTIGFARRFATYKRAPLFFRDMEWAIRMLNNKEKPVQLIFAGKAHPRDDAGKHFIQEIINMTKRLDMFGKVVFIENYDISVARYLVSGADVWLNTPRRPMEACGTSGEKVILHGGLNVSTMDGWWREAYDGKNGWAVGEDATAPTDHEQDDKDAYSLRTTLETEVVPLFYDRGKDGIPRAWLKRVRHSMATLIPQYNTDRMVVEYARKYYLVKKK